MQKTELVKSIAEAAGIPAKTADLIVNHIAEVATAELQSEGEFTLPGLGKLKTKTSAARTGRNPKTGESIEIAEKTVVKFTVAKALKDAVA